MYIYAIDDGGVSFFGPSETLEKAQKWFEILVAHVRSWDGFSPEQTQLHELRNQSGTSLC